MKPHLLLPLAGLLLTGAAHAAITIGPGPARGTDKHGVTWYEEFQDWAATDLKALDSNNDQYKFNDAHDPGRDLVAFYARAEGDNYYFRVDFFNLLFGAETGGVDVYVAIATGLGDGGGQMWFPDFTETQTDNPWRVCIALYDAAAAVYDKDFNNVAGGGNFLGAYWRADLDSVEFGIKKSVLTTAGWDGVSPLYFQVFTVRDGTNGGAGEIAGSDIVDAIVCPGCGDLQRDLGGGFGRLMGSIASTATVNRAKYAAIAHANQSIATRTGTSDHIYRDLGAVKPGFIRNVDSHEFFNAPLNMHLSGSLISSLLWARSSDVNRDGPTFLSRLKNFIDSGTGSLIGGVYSEHILPYFEGDVNRASLNAFNDLALDFFQLTTNQMKVMHTPERVLHSNTNWFKADPTQPLKGKPFADILAGGYVATYLDEVTHLHWWFYPGETNNVGWDENNSGRWAGGQGNDEETYHHKIHKINGVLTFMINDREDQSKFGNDDGGMLNDTRYTLLQKARAPDPAQITIVFDDWEAFAGNSFGQGANGNADQWHNTIRWAANHQWIQIVNLKDVVEWAQSDPSWVIDHGHVYDKSLETYEWLKKATEHSYDHWYFGHTGNGVVEENFAARVPGTAPSGYSIPGTKTYGDLNTPGTLLRDSWDKVAAMPAGRLKTLAEWAYSAMIFETAWHDENPPTWWNPDVHGNWFDAYKSRNYQITFQRPEIGSYDDADSNDPTSGWALRLHGHVRKVGIHADAAAWVQGVKTGSIGAATVVEVKDVDDDLWDEYILRNNQVYLCFKRWGGRLVYAFVFDPVAQDAQQVIGVPGANPAEEHDGEGADNNRCSAFKDRYVTVGASNSRYVDDDYALTAPSVGADYVEFVSSDSAIRKRFTLPAGRAAVRANYTIGAGAGTVYIRHGFGPNQLDLMLRGDANLEVDSAPLYYGLRNVAGGAVYAVNGTNTSRSAGQLPNAGYQNRELPLIEQVEQFTTAGTASFWLAFNTGAAQDIDGDGLSNDYEIAHGTDFENPDTDGDGMNDGFEVTYGLNPNNAGDAGLDGDGDGQTNLQEALAGTAPNDAASVFRISSVVTEPGGCTVTWQSIAGKTYQVFTTASLAAAFTPVGSPVVATGGTTSYPDAGATAPRFYKVKVIVP